MPPVNLTGPDDSDMWEAQCLRAGLRDGRASGYLLQPESDAAFTVIVHKAERFCETLTIDGRPSGLMDTRPGRIGNLTLAYLYGFAFSNGQGGMSGSSPRMVQRLTIIDQLSFLSKGGLTVHQLAKRLGWSELRLIALLTGTVRPDEAEEAAVAAALAEDGLPMQT